jgi:hypothetical protein
LDFKWTIDSGVIGIGLHQLAALTTFGTLEKKHGNILYLTVDYAVTTMF